MGPLLLAALGLAGFVAYEKFKPAAATSPSSATPAPATPNPPTGTVVTLDASIPDALRDQVISDLLYVSDPATLNAGATALSTAGYPCAAYELQLRVWQLSGGTTPAPVPPASCADVTPMPSSNFPASPTLNVAPQVLATACSLLDPTLDATTCSAVLNALATENSAQNLSAFAQTLMAQHPQAANALLSKASVLNAGGGAFPATPTPTVPGVPTAPAAAPSLDATLTSQQLADLANVLGPGVTDAASVSAALARYSAYPLASAALTTKLAIVQASAAIPGIVSPTGVAPAAQPNSGATSEVSPTTAGVGGQGGSEIVDYQAGAVPEIIDSANGPMRDYRVADINVGVVDDAIAQAAALSPRIDQGSAAYTSVNAYPAVAAASTSAMAGDPSVFQTGAGGAPSPSALTQPGRPRGHWFVEMRARDNVWPAQLAKFGSGNKQSASQLFVMNPHLVNPASQVIEAFKVGDQVNVPGLWSDALIRRGFKVRKD
jgi:hypothetical protein